MIEKIILMFMLMFALVTSSATSQTEAQWCKEFLKMEDHYQYGKYFKSISTAKRLNKKLSKIGNEPGLLIVTKALYLKYQAAKGLRVENDLELDKLFTSWDTTSGHQTDSVRIMGNLGMASCAFAFQKYLKAEEYLNETERYISICNDPYGFWAQRVRIARAWLNLETMYYKKAERIVYQAIRYQERVTVRKVVAKDTISGDSIMKKIPKKDFRMRMSVLGKLYVLLADISREKGDFAKADSIYSANREAKYLWRSKSDEGFLFNEFGYAQLKLMQGEMSWVSKMPKLRNKFAQNIKYNIPNIQYNSMFERELRTDLELGIYKKHAKMSQQYQRQIYKNYPNKSEYHFRAKHLVQLSDYYKGKYKQYMRRSIKQAELLTKYYGNYDAAQIPFLNDLVDGFERIYDYDKAEKILLRIIDITTKNNPDTSMLRKKAYLELGSFYVNNTPRFLEADSIFEANFSSFVADQIHVYHPLYEKYLSDYALIYRQRDMFLKSIEKYEDLSQVVKRKFGENSKEYGEVLTRLATTQMYLGHYTLASRNLYKAELSFKTAKATKSLSYAYTLGALGEQYRVNGDYINAKRRLEQASELAKKYVNIDEMLYTNIQEQMALLNIDISEYAKAEELLNLSKIKKSEIYGNEDIRLSNTYRLFGKMYIEQHQLSDAERMIRKALTISHRVYGDSSLWHLQNKELLIDYYYGAGSLERAQSLCDDIIEMYRIKFGGDFLPISGVLIRKTRIELELGNISNDVLLDNLKLAAKIVTVNLNDHHPKIAEIIELKALVLFKMGRVKDGLIQLQAANLIFTSSYGNNHPKTADNQVNIASLFFQSENYINALAFYNKALSTYAHIFGQKHPKYIFTKSKIGGTYYAQGNVNEAVAIMRETTQMYVDFISKTFPSLSNSQRQRYWNRIKHDFDMFNSLALDYYTIDPGVVSEMYNHQMFVKSLLHEYSMKINKIIPTYGSPDEVLKLDSLHLFRDSLSWAESYSLIELEQNGIDIQKLRETIDRLEKELSLSVERISSVTQIKKTTWNMLANRLESNEAAMEIIRVKKFSTDFTDSVVYVGLIVKKNTKNHPNIVILNSGNDLEGKHLNFYTNALSQKIEDKESYGHYWRDFDPHLQGISVIYLSSSGVYNLINPETFATSTSDYLLDKYTFYHIASTINLLNKEASFDYSDKSAVLCGNPWFAGDISEPLLGAEAEVKELDSLLQKNGWNVLRFTGKEAKETTLKSIISPRVLHIATHGFYTGPPLPLKETEVLDNMFYKPSNNLLSTGLLFAGSDSLLEYDDLQKINRSDGVLTALEAMNLKLYNTELVFLSACETGRNNIHSGGEVFGLQQAFRVAGAQNVVMALVRIDDKITKELVETFYKTWLNTEDKRLALTNAKKAIRSKYPEPLYWGAFVLIELN